MGHRIERGAPLVSQEVAGALHLARNTRVEWDTVTTRGERWALARSGITDPAEVHRELEQFRLFNRSVAFHVVERTITLREQLVEDSAVGRPAVAQQ